MKHISQALTTTTTTTTKNSSTTNTTSPSDNVMKTIIERLRTKSSNELLDNNSNQPVQSSTNPSSTTNVTRLEKIFKTKYTTIPPPN